IIRLCDRRLGVGSDGVLLFERAETPALARMIYFNSDGSRAETCFNGLRCVALHAARSGVVESGQEFSIQSDAGIVKARVESGFNGVSICMAGPEFDPSRVPLHLDQPVIETNLDFDRFSLTGTALSLGNPHFVVWKEDSELDQLNRLIFEWGAEVEHAVYFPARVNFEIASVVDPRTIHAAIWERGVGRTPACGSGATAAVCAGVKTGRLPVEQPIVVIMAGGRLTITPHTDLKQVSVTGEAAHVFNGQIEL
ncbi:MAG: diaminopimelate epimerase, partial [Calditrichota bacterium]